MPKLMILECELQQQKILLLLWGLYSAGGDNKQAINKYICNMSGSHEVSIESAGADLGRD